jgi:hypothetical protein
MHRHRLPAVCLIGAVLLAALAAAQVTYTFTPLAVPVPGTTGTAALGINTRGQIVGDYVDSIERPTFHGFLATPHEE